MNQRHERRGAGIFGGLIFLILGIVLLMGNFDLFPVRPTLAEWWPAILVLFGIKHLLMWRGRNAWIGSAFWIGTGLLFLTSTLGYVNVGIPTLLWPVMLIWFGVFTVLGCGACGNSLSGRSEP
jgi:LiaF transmembrane domain